MIKLIVLLTIAMMLTGCIDKFVMPPNIVDKATEVINRDCGDGQLSFNAKVESYQKGSKSEFTISCGVVK